MNITKENFNQYVVVATALAREGLYAEATKIALEAYEVWEHFPDDIKEEQDEINVSAAIRTLTFSQWREVNDAEDCALLSEILNRNSYWLDEFIEQNMNYTGAWILREKALAYHMLAERWATGQLKDIYLDYAQSYMQDAIKIFGEIAQSENGDETRELCNDSKIDLAVIQFGISNRLARCTAIALLGEKLTNEQKERLMEIYRKSTDALFDDYFAKKGIAVIQNAEEVDESVKDDLLEFSFDLYSEGNEDEFWWLFTHKEAPEERKKIRFVEKIEDASDNNFDEIPWVFTLDYIPSDIEFANGEEPTAGAVYEVDAENPAQYHRI